MDEEYLPILLLCCFILTRPVPVRTDPSKTPKNPRSFGSRLQWGAEGLFNYFALKHKSYYLLIFYNHAILLYVVSY